MPTDSYVHKLQNDVSNSGLSWWQHSQWPIGVTYLKGNFTINYRSMFSTTSLSCGWKEKNYTYLIGHQENIKRTSMTRKSLKNAFHDRTHFWFVFYETRWPFLLPRFAQTSERTFFIDFDVVEIKKSWRRSPWAATNRYLEGFQIKRTFF